MAVYVDHANILFRGKRRHHMTADTLDELHSFAAGIGVNRCWYHRGTRHPHYDVNDEQRARAITAGALAVDTRVIVTVASRLG